MDLEKVHVYSFNADPCPVQQGVATNGFSIPFAPCPHSIVPLEWKSSFLWFFKLFFYYSKSIPHLVHQDYGTPLPLFPSFYCSLEVSSFSSLGGKFFFHFLQSTLPGEGQSFQPCPPSPTFITLHRFPILWGLISLSWLTFLVSWAPGPCMELFHRGVWGTAGFPIVFS